jgi:hypothetical protein
MALNRFSTFAAATLSLAGVLTAADKIDIRTHYQSGKVYTLENTMEMGAAMPAAGPGGNQKTHMTQTMTIAVKDEPGSTNRLATVKFASIKATMNMGGQAVSYDSADPAKALPFLQQAFGALVGKEFSLVYDKDDKVIEARGMDAVTPTPVGGARSMDGKQMVDAFKKSQEMFLPPQAVAPGDTWTFEGKVEMPPVGTFASKGSGKFDSIVDVDGRKHAKLTITGSLAMTESNSPAKLGEGSNMNVEMLFDLDRKIADSTTTNCDIKINAAGQEVAMKQTNVAKVISIVDAPKETTAAAPSAPASAPAPVPGK